MSGRPTTRAGARQETTAALSPPRRPGTRRTPALDNEAPMPPPPTPSSKSGVATRNQVKANEPNIPIYRRGAPQRDPASSSQLGSVASFPTQVTQEDDDQEEEASGERDKGITEQQPSEFKPNSSPKQMSGSNCEPRSGDGCAGEH